MCISLKRVVKGFKKGFRDAGGAEVVLFFGGMKLAVAKDERSYQR
jgi:hypothetical protein